MNVWEWENLGNVVKYALEEVDYLVVSNVEHVLRDTTVNAYRVLLVRITAEFRVCCNGCNHVAWEVNLGQDVDVALCCVGNNLAQVVL